MAVSPAGTSPVFNTQYTEGSIARDTTPPIAIPISPKVQQPEEQNGSLNQRAGEVFHRERCFTDAAEQGLHPYADHKKDSLAGRVDVDCNNTLIL